MKAIHLHLQLLSATNEACWYHGTTHAGREYALRVYSRYGNNLFYYYIKSTYI